MHPNFGPDKKLANQIFSACMDLKLRSNQNALKVLLVDLDDVNAFKQMFSWSKVE